MAVRLPFERNHPLELAPRLRELLSRGSVHKVRTRFPTMRLAVPVSELTLRRDTLTGGLVNLPVTW